MYFQVILVMSVMLCRGSEEQQDNSGHVLEDRISSQQMILVRIINDVIMQSFWMNPNDTTAQLYRSAHFIGILNLLNNTVLWDSGRCIPYDDSMRLSAILAPPSSFPNLKVRRELILHVFAVEQIEITVQIENGDTIKSFTANAGMRTSEVYRQAVRMGIMENSNQFLLHYRYERDKVLVFRSSPSSPPLTLIECVDPRSPRELKFIVAPYPEGLLLFAMFRDMAPNQHISFWEYAKFCNLDPWHAHCSDLSWRFEYDQNEDASEMSENSIGDWSNVHDIVVVNVPTWSGVLHLENIPKSVRSMNLHGQSVTINLESLRFSSLKELILDFNQIIGFETILGITGSQLEVLRLPHHIGLLQQDQQHVLNKLTRMRSKGEIVLKEIAFGRVMREQQFIRYDPKTKQYIYVHFPCGRFWC